MTNTAFLFPLVLAWLLGVVLLALDGRRRPARFAASTGLAVVFTADVVLFLELRAGDVHRVTTGGWPAQVGITLQVDAISAFFAASCAFVALVVLAQGLPRGARDRHFPAWILLLTAALHGMYFTNDLFDFYVFFELGVMTSFVLALHGYGKREIRGGAIYVVVNLVGSVAFLIGITLAYRAFGTLELDALTERAAEAPPGIVLLVGALVFSSLGLKLGLFPFHWWVPSLYAHARPAVTAVLAGALSNVGAYGLLRFGTTFLETARIAASDGLIVLGAASALYGSLLAARRRSPAEASSYAAVAHVGYILVAIGLGTADGFAAALLLVLAGALDKALVFCCLELSSRSRRALGIVGACSIAGLPVTIGFVAKALLVHESLASPGGGALVAVLLVSAGLSLFYVARYWFGIASWEAARLVPAWAPALLGIAIVALGVWPDPLVDWASAAGARLVESAP